ncbi:MAG TPA: NlpC/P60 family protein, partial [Verrucomicrobiae bacterium]|nr:NlpC/P60 family protein [Verrucomicrobiae bacterium]
RQAFKLLGARYGWGGQYNGRDCSGFTHDVFLSLGAEIPRDSKYQSIIGTQISAFTPYKDAQAKIQALRSSAPGMTLIKMPAHMMLYLGEVNGNFYVIHSTWAERYDMKSDAKNRINQVVVSDLTLNGKSYLGSLFDRIVGINEMN